MRLSDYRLVYLESYRTYVEKVNEDVCRKGKYLELIQFSLHYDSIFILKLTFLDVFYVLFYEINIYTGQNMVDMHFFSILQDFTLKK